MVRSAYDDKIGWYENDGGQNFTAHTISIAADEALSVIAADVDGDGDTDVLSVSYRDGKVTSHVNDGNENFTAHTITSAADGADSVVAADADGDGDIDVFSASFEDDKIAWYENDGSQNFTTHIISTTVKGAFDVFVADVDGDGDLDVLSASLNDDMIAWYENRRLPPVPIPPPPIRHLRPFATVNVGEQNAHPLGGGSLDATATFAAAVTGVAFDVAFISMRGWSGGGIKKPESSHWDDKLIELGGVLNVELSRNSWVF